MSVVDKSCSYSEAMIFSQSIDDKDDNMYVSSTNPSSPTPKEGLLMNIYVCNANKLHKFNMISQLAALVEQSILHLWLRSQD